MPSRVVCQLDEYGNIVSVISIEADDTAAQNKCDSEADNWITANPGDSPVKRAVADGVFVDISVVTTRGSKKNSLLGADWDIQETRAYPKVKFQWTMSTQ